MFKKLVLGLFVAASVIAGTVGLSNNDADPVHASTQNTCQLKQSYEPYIDNNAFCEAFAGGSPIGLIANGLYFNTGVDKWHRTSEWNTRPDVNFNVWYESGQTWQLTGAEWATDTWEYSTHIKLDVTSSSASGGPSSVCNENGSNNIKFGALGSSNPVYQVCVWSTGNVEAILESDIIVNTSWVNSYNLTVYLTQALGVAQGLGIFNDCSYTGQGPRIMCADAVEIGSHVIKTKDWASQTNLYGDSDFDGCTDVEEDELAVVEGGSRYKYDTYDFVDLTDDGFVDFSDALLVNSLFGIDRGAPGWRQDADVLLPDPSYPEDVIADEDPNSFIDLSDTLIVLGQFGHDCTPSPN